MLNIRIFNVMLENFILPFIMGVVVGLAAALLRRHFESAIVLFGAVFGVAVTIQFVGQADAVNVFAAVAGVVVAVSLFDVIEWIGAIGGST